MLNTTDANRAHASNIDSKLVDIHAVESELIILEGLRDALRIALHSDHPRQHHALRVLVDLACDQVSRVRFALEGHPEPSIEEGRAQLEGEDVANNEGERRGIRATLAMTDLRPRDLEEMGANWRHTVRSRCNRLMSDVEQAEQAVGEEAA